MGERRGSRSDERLQRSRRYPVAPSALHAGRNILAVRVADGGGGGGINGAAALVFGDGTQRSLAGAWKFKVGEVSFQPDGQQINKVPSVLYNKMLHPLLPFAIKGVLWYQGESNANNVPQAAAYRGQFTTLIDSWRHAWGSGREAFPFLWVQLPNFGKPDSVPPATAAWATQRESMAAALSLPKTGQAIAIDVGEGELHPRNKQDVGARLARVALRTRVWRTGRRVRPVVSIAHRSRRHRHRQFQRCDRWFEQRLERWHRGRLCDRRRGPSIRLGQRADRGRSSEGLERSRQQANRCAVRVGEQPGSRKPLQRPAPAGGTVPNRSVVAIRLTLILIRDST